MPCNYLRWLCIEAAELGKGHTSAALLVNRPSCPKLVNCTFKLSNLISADKVYNVPQALCGFKAAASRRKFK